MPIATGPIILGGVVVALLLASSGGTKKGEYRDPLKDKVVPLPAPDDKEGWNLIAQAICVCHEEGAKDLEALRLCTLAAIFPDVPWPPVDGDHPSIHEAWKQIGDRCQAFLTIADKAAYCAAILHPDEQSIADIFGDWLSDVPTPGKFYIVQKGDTMSDIARKALNSVVPSSGQDNQTLLQYIYCVSSGPNWNAEVYGSSGFSETYPAMYSVNGVGLRAAFMPWNENARSRVLSKRMPKRGVSPGGTRIPGVGSSYGMLWLPPVDIENLAEFGEPTCAPFNWGDGSSSIDPPPELLAMLED